MLPSTGWQNSRRDRAHHIGPPRYAENAVGTLGTLALTAGFAKELIIEGDSPLTQNMLILLVKMC